MAGKRKAPAKKAAAKKVAPELVHEDGFWWIVSGRDPDRVLRASRLAGFVLGHVLLGHEEVERDLDEHHDGAHREHRDQEPEPAVT
jgi:hypothetical protein